MSETPKIRVIVVDDSSFMRNILTRMIERDPRFEIVGKATNGQEGVDMVRQHRPDVVTMDIEMPVMNGLEALRIIMREMPTPVIMVSSLTESGAKETLEALEIGAIDVVPKALNDADRSVFRQSDTIHEKLAAAAQARIPGRKMAPPPAASTMPAARPSTALAQSTTATAAPFKAQVRPGKIEGVRLILIGVSTGGPKALQEFIPSLPANLKAPVLVIQHMPPGFTGPMAQRLAERSALKVVEAHEGQELKPGTVYVAPGGRHVRVSLEGNALKVHIADDAGESPYRPSVDVAAESALKAVGKNVVCVMLTGMGSDGAAQFLNLRKAGAYVLAQNQATCVVYGMPRAVVENGAANEVLPLSEIANVLQILVS